MDDIRDAIAVPYGDDLKKWVEWAISLPVSRALDIECDFHAIGEAEVRLARSAWPVNANGAIHGGYVAALADHCFGIVGMSVLEEGVVPATSTLNVEYVRPAVPPLTCDARVDKAGHTLLFITVHVRNGLGRLAAKVTGTMVADGSSRPILAR